MKADVSGEVADLRCGIFLQTLRDLADPSCRSGPRFTAGGLDEAPHGRAETALVSVPHALTCEQPRLQAGAAAHPMHDRQVHRHRMAKPGWVELDFELFEACGPNRVAMRNAAAIED